MSEGRTSCKAELNYCVVSVTPSERPKVFGGTVAAYTVSVEKGNVLRLTWFYYQYATRVIMCDFGVLITYFTLHSGVLDFDLTVIDKTC